MVLYGLPLAQFLPGSLTVTYFQHIFLSVDFAWGLYALNPHSFTSPSLYSGNTSQGPFFDSILHSPYMVLFFFKGLITVGVSPCIHQLSLLHQDKHSMGLECFALITNDFPVLRDVPSKQWAIYICWMNGVSYARYFEYIILFAIQKIPERRLHSSHFHTLKNWVKEVKLIHWRHTIPHCEWRYKSKSNDFRVLTISILLCSL